MINVVKYSMEISINYVMGSREGGVIFFTVRYDIVGRGYYSEV